MVKSRTSKRRAQAVGSALFFIGLAIIAFTDYWWPGIMLVIGIPIAVRQYLLGRFSDMLVSLIVFGGVFVTAQFEIPWKVLLPILFLIAGVYILFREFIESFFVEPEEEKEESINLEIGEKKKK